MKGSWPQDWCMQRVERRPHDMHLRVDETQGDIQ